MGAWLPEVLDRARERRMIRRRLQIYAAARPVFWCSPYCHLSFATEHWRAVHRSVCPHFGRYEREVVSGGRSYGAQD